MREFGPHSAGSAVLLGNTRLSLELERHLAGLLGMEHVTLYPTGWAAGYGAIAAFVRPRDFIVMDYLCHACLQQGAAAATPQINHFIHNDAEDLRDRLKSIRAKDARNGIMVITEGLFAMESDTPDLGALQSACREFGATLLVDVANDLGALGPGGGGAIALQGLLGKVDLVMGSFAKAFASNGGFSPRTPRPPSSSPSTTAIRTCSRTRCPRCRRPWCRRPFASSDRRRATALRQRLMACVSALRDGFAAQGITCHGTPSPIVLVPFTDDRLARLTSRRVAASGVFIDLVEYPAVPVEQARLRLQAMATHEVAQVEEAVRLITEAQRLAEQDLKAWRSSAP